MKKKRLLWLGSVLLVLLGVLLYRSNCCLQVDYYQLSSKKLREPLRILQLSDLHNAEFGEENEDLLAAVAAQQPDLILFTGDLVTGTDPETERAEKLLKALTELTPVYISIGNHERLYEEHYGTDLTELYESAGVTVLEYTYEDTTVKGQPLRIGGISGYCVPEEHLATGEAKIEQCQFLQEMAQTEAVTLLMCHMPYSWQALGALDAWDMDLVFSGHSHGGQWVLPLLGPVYAPDMGLFPGKSEGLFSSVDGASHLLLSRGLGSSVAIPRLNNVPQILVLDILPEQAVNR